MLTGKKPPFYQDEKTGQYIVASLAEKAVKGKTEDKAKVKVPEEKKAVKKMDDKKNGRTR